MGDGGNGVKCLLMERSLHEEAGYMTLGLGHQKKTSEPNTTRFPLILLAQKGNIKVTMGDNDNNVIVSEPGIICIPEGCRYKLEALSGCWDHAAIFFVRTRMNNELFPGY